MRFIRKDDTPGDFALINVDQINKVQVRNEKRPDALQVDVYFADGQKETFKGIGGQRMLDYLENLAGQPYLMPG
jgi:hypothetical protein